MKEEVNLQFRGGQDSSLLVCFAGQLSGESRQFDIFVVVEQWILIFLRLTLHL